METGKPSTNPFLIDLKRIETELNAIWKLLSPEEKQKLVIFQKMNRVRMTLHRLIYSQRWDVKPQVQYEPSRGVSEAPQSKETKRD